MSTKNKDQDPLTNDTYKKVLNRQINDKKMCRHINRAWDAFKDAMFK